MRCTVQRRQRLGNVAPAHAERGGQGGPGGLPEAHHDAGRWMSRGEVGGRNQPMKAFLAAVLAAILIAVGSAFALDLLDRSAANVYRTHRATCEAHERGASDRIRVACGRPPRVDAPAGRPRVRGDDDARLDDGSAASGLVDSWTTRRRATAQSRWCPARRMRRRIAPPTPRSASAPSSWPERFGTGSASGKASASPRSPGTTTGISSCTTASPGSARSVTRSIRACSPIRSPTS